MKLSTLAQRHGVVRRGIAAVAVAGLGASVFLGVSGMPAHADGLNNDKDIVLGVGSNATQRTLAWYSDTGDAQQLVYGPADTFSAGTGATTVDVTPVKNTQGATDKFNARAVLKDLAPNTKYAYKVGSSAGGWSQTFTFATKATGFGTGFAADFFGDPQIGASGQADLDGAGWVQTVKFAQQHDTDSELYLSGGDQIDATSATSTLAGGANQVEDQWDNFIRPFNRGGSDIAAGDEIPWASTIGNHDVATKTYQQHLAQPNLTDDSRYYSGDPASVSGGDYWFTYRDVLFIDINSNSYSATSGTLTGDPAHVAYIKNVVAAHGSDAKYKVLIYHHSIYSPADHANDSDNAQRRADFTTAFSQLGINLVLQGHDHSYSRSYSIKNGARTGEASELSNGTWGAEQSAGAGNPDGTTILPGPGGVIYVTANSASGSKYYDLTAPGTANNRDYGPDQSETTAQAQANGAVTGGHTNHWANAVENQEHVQSYLQVNFGADAITVNDVRSGDTVAGSPNAAVQRGNVPWAGTVGNTFAGATKDANGNLATAATPVTPSVNDAWNAAHPKGSLVDKVTIQQFVAPSAVTITGAPKVGQKLTANLTGAFTTGTAVSYAWTADGVEFATGRTATIGADQRGKRIVVAATGVLGSYDPETVSSAPTTAVPGAQGPAGPAGPAASIKSSAPIIKGKARVGKKLRVVVGSWSSGARLTTTWYVGKKAVHQGASLKLAKKYAGKKVKVLVTGVLGGAEASNLSAPTSKIKKKK